MAIHLRHLFYYILLSDPDPVPVGPRARADLLCFLFLLFLNSISDCWIWTYMDTDMDRMNTPG